MKERTAFAKVTWNLEDIKSLRPKWTEDKCEDFLRDNEGYIQDRLIELGWDVISTLLSEGES